MTLILPMQALDPDSQFFLQHMDRHAHIRDAKPQEFSAEFNQLGMHDMDRRRILLWRGPRNTELAGRVVKIAFLAFGDETIEDTDKVLMPLLKEIMQQQGKQYGLLFGNA